MTARVIAVNSSPRPKRLSHGGVMLDAVREHLALVRPGWEWEEVQLVSLDFSTCDGNGRCFRRDGCVFDDDAEELIERMIQADGIILSSPNYCANVNSTMMRFIERTTRLSHRRLLTGKGALALSTSASPIEADHAAAYLRRVLGSYGASVVDACNIGSPMIVYDFQSSPFGVPLRRSVEAFVAAVEDPAAHLPQETFGIDIRRSLREQPALARRMFRSDDRYFRSLDDQPAETGAETGARRHDHT